MFYNLISFNIFGSSSIILCSSFPNFSLKSLINEIFVLHALIYILFNILKLIIQCFHCISDFLLSITDTIFKFSFSFSCILSAWFLYQIWPFILLCMMFWLRLLIEILFPKHTLPFCFSQSMCRYLLKNFLFFLD